MANEKRLIDANALKREIRKMPWAVRKAETNGKEEIEAIINDAPTVDAVEVMRCKDCKHWERRLVNAKGFTICAASGMDITEDDFCSYGERKDNESVQQAGSG